MLVNLGADLVNGSTGKIVGMEEKAVSVRFESQIVLLNNSFLFFNT